jgi:hypothetical protein
VRWIPAIVVFWLGLAAAAITVFGGAFATVARVEVPSEWVYHILIAAGVVMPAAAPATSVPIVRGNHFIRVAMPAVLGMIFMCGGLMACFGFLRQYCWALARPRFSWLQIPP